MSPRLRIAASIAAVSTRPPRLVLMKTAFGFRSEKKRSPKSPLVSFVCGMWTLTASERAASSSSDSAKPTPAASASSRVNGTDQELNPPAPGLSGRIWESALTEQTGRDSARRGNGVLIGTTQTVPAEITAAAYHSSLPGGVPPRVGLVVHVHPGRDRASALSALAADVETVYAWGREWLPHASTLEEKAAVINVHYGTPEQIAESIRAFPAFPYTTELQFSVAYGTTSYAQRRSAVEAVASEIAPALGWKPDDGALRA